MNFMNVRVAEALDRRGRSQSYVRVAIGAVIGLGCVAAVPVYAQSAVGFRSGFTEGTGIPPRGAIELDYGSSFTAAGDTRTYAAGELTAHIPVARRVGVRLHVNSYTWITTPGTMSTGREDVGVGTAMSFRDTRGWRPMVALLTRLDTPTGSLPNRVREWRPSAKIALAWRLPAGVALASNVGVARPSDHGARFTHAFGSVWVARSVTRKIGSFTEFVTFNRETRLGPSTYALRSGVTVLASQTMHFDLHASMQLGADRPRRTFGIGLKERF